MPTKTTIKEKRKATLLEKLLGSGMARKAAKSLKDRRKKLDEAIRKAGG